MEKRKKNWKSRNSKKIPFSSFSFVFLSFIFINVCCLPFGVLCELLSLFLVFSVFMTLSSVQEKKGWKAINKNFCISRWALSFDDPTRSSCLLCTLTSTLLSLHYAFFLAFYYLVFSPCSSSDIYYIQHWLSALGIIQFIALNLISSLDAFIYARNDSLNDITTLASTSCVERCLPTTCNFPKRSRARSSC